MWGGGRGAARRPPGQTPTAEKGAKMVSTQWKQVSGVFPHNGKVFREFFHTMEACFGMFSTQWKDVSRGFSTVWKGDETTKGRDDERAGRGRLKPPAPMPGRGRFRGVRRGGGRRRWLRWGGGGRRGACRWRLRWRWRWPGRGRPWGVRRGPWRRAGRRCRGIRRR